MSKQCICSVYRSPRHEGMYLYVEKAAGLKQVPEALKERFGAAELAMTLLLKEDRPMAQADAAKVLAAIEEQGFYLQLPPAEQLDEAQQQIRDRNSKL